MPAVPAEIVTALENTQVSVRWKSVFGQVHEFPAHCCNIDSDAIMGVSKQPVVDVDLNADIICLGNTIIWDLTGSYAPGSTITAYLIDPGDSSGTYNTSTGNHTYAAVGDYTMVITVTEGGGLSGTRNVNITVIECDDADSAISRYLYVLDFDHGLYFLDFNDLTTGWLDRTVDPVPLSPIWNHFAWVQATRHLPSSNHELWVVEDKSGLYHSIDGGRSWAQIILPSPTLPAGVTLSYRWVLLDPTDPDTLYIGCSTSSQDPSFLFKSSDHGIVWSVREVQT